MCLPSLFCASQQYYIHYLPLLWGSFALAELFIHSDSTFHQSTHPFFTCRHATCSHMWLHWETRYLWQHEPTTITGSYLALGAFLGVSLTMLDDTRPGSEQLVSFSILPTFQPVMPWGVAFKAPHELAIATLDLQDGKKSMCSFYGNVRGEMWICGDGLISPCTCAQSGWSRAPSEW